MTGPERRRIEIELRMHGHPQRRSGCALKIIEIVQMKIWRALRKIQLGS
jgi:hypothetical protein